VAVTGEQLAHVPHVMMIPTQEWCWALADANVVDELQYQ
jgi:hypothetical protein